MATQNSILSFFPKRRKIEDEKHAEDKQCAVRIGDENSENGAPGTEASIKRFTWDIGRYLGMSLTDYQKYQLLKCRWKPGKNHVYPAVMEGKSKRRFRGDYLDLFQPWLCRSEELCGAFCKYCIIFAANRGAGNGDHVLPGALVSKPLKKFKDVKEVCAGHATKFSTCMPLPKQIVLYPFMKEGPMTSLPN